MWETAMMRYKVADECESDLVVCLRLSFGDLTRNRLRDLRYDER